MRRLSYSVLILAISLSTCLAQKIDRKALVTRHNVVITKVDTLGSLTVGNGKFAFTVDATGMQSFPEYYKNGVPLGTESEWGWHSFPNKQGYKYSETLQDFDFNKDGSKSSYAVQLKSGRGKAAGDYFRANPHRLQLGNIGLDLHRKDGTPVKPSDISDIHQELNLWTGEITSHFKIEGVPVTVTTCADANSDIVSFKIVSRLVRETNRLAVKFQFPNPSGDWADMGTDYKPSASNKTVAGYKEPVGSDFNHLTFTRKLDNATYYVSADWTGNSRMNLLSDNCYELFGGNTDTLMLSVGFSKTRPQNFPSAFRVVEKSGKIGWQKYWLSGAAVDLSGSTDSRANELERRIVLSQYLMRVQEAGHYPPQETGLTYNSWYGRPHMEMLGWHTAHYALWGHPELMEKSMRWYFKAFKGAKTIAERQGYKGVRWQKMTDNDGGETPSNVGSFLIWQQPNVIYEAELLYRDKPSKELVRKYSKLIFATADFMASFAHYNPVTGRYDLGKGIIPAQESYNPAETFNSPYELVYWKWALQTAQSWRKRSGLAPDKNWQAVIDKLAPLAVKDGVYKAAESVEDSYSPQSKYTTDHPAVLMTLSTLPINGVVDTAIMHRTFDVVKKTWHWEHTWGWDFPVVAMTATRLNQPEEAIDALFKNVTTNTWLINGHNYQNDRLTIYLPGNGSLLSAIALMCAGYNGNKISNPGFPKNGKWKVKWEGLKPLP
jgi:hypothetical protein